MHHDRLELAVEGSAKGPEGWFAVDRAYVRYDHPYHAQVEHALGLDFVNEQQGLAARVAVELTRESAHELLRQLQTALGESRRLRGRRGSWPTDDRTGRRLGRTGRCVLPGR